MSTETRPHGFSPDRCRYCARYRRACGRNYFEATARTRAADILRDAGDTLHGLARKVDPPEYGVRVVWDEGYTIDGATAWGEPEDSEYAAETAAKLESGEWVVVGLVAIERDRDGTVRETDIPSALWGIVSPSSEIGAGADDSFPADVFDLDAELSGYLRTVADEVIAEAKP